MSGIMREDAMGTQGSAVTWQNSPNSIPSNGRFILDDHGAGATGPGAMLIVATSVSRGTPGQVGSGGMCLTDSSGELGAQPTIQPCDATDKAQYWSLVPATS